MVAELGSFYADRGPEIVLVLDIPGIPALGLTEVATLEFTYVELPDLKQHTISVPLLVNVVPGDEAAGRVPDATVRTELVYLQAQQAKRRASQHLSAGDSASALLELQSAQDEISHALPLAPAGLVADLTEESQALGYLTRETEEGSVAPGREILVGRRVVHKSGKRGRRPRRPPRTLLTLPTLPTLPAHRPPKPQRTRSTRSPRRDRRHWRPGITPGEPGNRMHAGRAL